MSQIIDIKSCIEWLRIWIADRRKLALDQIDNEIEFSYYGLDSIDSVQLAANLEENVAHKIEPTILFNYPSINKLAIYLDQILFKSQKSNVINLLQQKKGNTSSKDLDVAIIGMACRLPGANNLDEFWQLLINGTNAISSPPIGHSHTNSNFKGGYLNKIDYFANDFFNISPREAKCIDPQQRILLETCYSALEDTAIPIDTLTNSNTGVFIGIASREYDQLQSSDNNIYAATGGASSIAANRISYFFDFKGPSIAIDTACSSSLMAVHLACNSLKHQESSLAIAGGVNLLLSLENTEKFAAMGFLSPDFKCMTFDESANGYVRSEGVGIIILKPLQAAIKDGNRIYAVIKHTATNQDGHTNGITAPNQNSQEQLLRQAYYDANLDPSTIDYIECHGTGTALGDPIEVGALNKVIGQNRDINQKCKIGSVKTNIGHLEAAAGIAGLIKVALMIHNKKLVPSLHFKHPNKAINFNNIPFSVQQEIEDLASRQKIICGLNSFGFGGSNVHAILTNSITKFNSKKISEKLFKYKLLPISAKSKQELKLQHEYYSKYLKDNPNFDFTSICSSAALNYMHYHFRNGIIATDNLDAIRQLDNFSESRDKLYFTKNPRICFIFTGQGSQWSGMAKQLLNHIVFRKWVIICDSIITEFAEFSILEVLESHDDINLLESSVFQPTLVTFQIALTEYLHYLGLKPVLVIGHSLGELVAAFISGAISLEQTLEIAFKRGMAMGNSRPGAMLIISETPLIVQELIDKSNLNLDIAIINSHKSSVVSGLIDEIDQFKHYLETSNIDYFNLNSKYAFHSRYIEPIVSEFESTLTNLTTHTFKVPMISTANLQELTTNDLTANYWATQIRKPVQFAYAIDKALTYEIDIFLEIGASSALINYINDIVNSNEKKANILGITKKNSDEDFQLLQALGKLYQMGCNLDWSKLYNKTFLEHTPHYQFYQQPYWFNTTKSPSIEEVNMSTTTIKTQILDRLTSIIANLIQTNKSDIDLNKPFIELGADSIIIVNAIKKIQTEFGLKIEIRRLFEDLSTINKLASFIEVKTPNNSNGIQKSVNLLTNEPQKTLSKPQSSHEITNFSLDTNAPELEKLFSQQLSIMNQQLELLATSDLKNLSDTSQFVEYQEDENANLACSINLQNKVVKRIKEPSNEATGWQNRPIDTTPVDQKFDSIQQISMLNLIEAYTLKTKTSKALTAKYRSVLADSKASVGFRLSIKEMLYPIVGSKTYGSKLIDIDNNEYIDITMGFGVHLCGYNPEFINKTLLQELDSGIQLGPRSPIVGEVAELISELTGFERVAFSNTGTESVITAIRIARAATSKNKIVIFRGSYHGHSDYALVEAYTTDENGNTIPITPGIPSNVLDNTIVLEYGDFAELEIIRNQSDDIAAVLVEPVQSRNPELQPIEFVQELRKLTHDLDIALIFDEMVTGFRSHLGGAQVIFGIKADMATYGKIIGGGLPIGVIAGTKKYMDHIDGGNWQYKDSSYPAVERTFFGGTFCQHPTSLATAYAILKYLKNEGHQLQTTLNQKTAYLANELNQFFIAENVPIKIVYFASLFRFKFQGNYDLLFYYLIMHGVYVWEWRNCFLSTAHSDDDINQIIQAVKQSIYDMKQGKFIK